MLICSFFSCFSPYFLSRLAHNFIQKSPHSLSKCLGSSTVYQGFCQVQGTYKAELDRVPCPRGSYRSGGQYKVTRVECDKCCHWVFRMFRMSGPFLVCCVTQVCLAFIPNHPFHETLFHAFRFQCMCLVFLLPNPLVDSCSVLCSTLKRMSALFTPFHEGHIDWTTGLKTF